MKEINDIIQAFDEAQKQQEKTALATVVHVDGSSYRRPGARMLITENGKLTGAISGGCLEGDALRKALLVMMEQKARLVTYDTTDEDDATLGLGLGCNGIIQVLIEPIDPSNPGNPIQLLKKVTAKRGKAVLVTLFALADKKAIQPGTCLLVTEDGTPHGTAPVWTEELIYDAKEVLNTGQPIFKNYSTSNQSLTAFVEYLKPTVHLVIVGAGNDVIPLVQLATILGWQVTITEERPFYRRQEKYFPSCQVLTIKPENILQHIPIDDGTVFILMTHNYNYDKAILRVLINQPLNYIGMLGPKKKLVRMLDELHDEGIVLSQQKRSVIHSPVGLDIGAETPEEIALSIVAEIKAVMAGRQPYFLKEIEDVIHPRSATLIRQVKIDPNKQ